MWTASSGWSVTHHANIYPAFSFCLTTLSVTVDGPCPVDSIETILIARALVPFLGHRGVGASRLFYLWVPLDSGLNLTWVHWQVHSEALFFNASNSFFLFFFNVDHFLVYWICYNIASILCFVPLVKMHVGSYLSTRGRTCTPCNGRQSLNHWTTREVP